MDDAKSSNLSGCIDAHAHVWTPDVARYPLSAGYSPRDMEPASFTADELLAIARPVGIDRIVLIQMIFYGSDNSYMLDCMREYPGVFSGVAQIDEQGADPAAEMERLRKFGVRGVRIAPPKHGDAGWLDGPGMHAMWKFAAQSGMAMCPLIDPDDLAAVDRMCEKFPETPVVVDHCARIGGDGDIRNDDLAHLCQLARYKRTHVKLSAFYFLGDKQPPYEDLAPMILRLCGAYGPERLMWASDCPFQVLPPHTYKASVELIRNRVDVLTNSEREWILRRTAESVFFGDTG